jgi:hypothetical protein
MVLFPGAILFEAAASSATEPDQESPQPATPWVMILRAPPPDDLTLIAFAPVPGPDPFATPPGPPPGIVPPDPPAMPQPPEPPLGDPALPPPPAAAPGEPLPFQTILAAIAGAAPAPRPDAPPGAPPPGSGGLDFEALLARLLAPVVVPVQPACDMPPPAFPAPFLPPAPVAEEPWGARDWSLL